MVNFFRQAPVRETDQKRFMEAILQRQNVIASFPLEYPLVSLYALTGVMGSGMAVVVVPDVGRIRRNLEYFKGASLKFPDVAFIDGSQMPHEERSIHEEINRNKVKLLYITPERFTSLAFLQVLVHTEISFLAIEEAERFLPMMPGYGRYHRFYEDGLSRLGKLPPMVLLVPPLPPFRLRELSERLNLNGFFLIQNPPLMAPIEVRANLLFTENQKFLRLISTLSGNPGKGKLGRLDETGAVLIQTAFPAQAEKLGASLLDYGFESVWITHFKKSPRDQALAKEVAAARLNTIIVNAGSDMQDWLPPAEASPRVIYWSPPSSLEEFFFQVFRQVQGGQQGYGGQHALKAMLFHTREDYFNTLQRLQGDPVRTAALEHYRRWILSEECRLQTLAAYYQSSGIVEFPPCGRCDRCLQQPQERRLLRRLLKSWLF